MYLAGWGYTNKDQRKKAQKNKIPIINIEKFKEITKRFISKVNSPKLR